VQSDLRCGPDAGSATKVAARCRRR
jgi:hypothetical protein